MNEVNLEELKKSLEGLKDIVPTSIEKMMQVTNRLKPTRMDKRTVNGLECPVTVTEGCVVMIEFPNKETADAYYDSLCQR